MSVVTKRNLQQKQQHVINCCRRCPSCSHPLIPCRQKQQKEVLKKDFWSNFECQFFWWRLHKNFVFMKRFKIYLGSSDDSASSDGGLQFSTPPPPASQGPQWTLPSPLQDQVAVYINYEPSIVENNRLLSLNLKKKASSFFFFFFFCISPSKDSV